MKLEKFGPDKVEQWVQCEANKQRLKVRSWKDKAENLPQSWQWKEIKRRICHKTRGNERKSNGAIWRHICEQVARRRPWERRIRGKGLLVGCEIICYEDASHYLHFLHCSHWSSGQTSIRLFYISLGWTTFEIDVWVQMMPSEMDVPFFRKYSKIFKFDICVRK